jgi:hypothetical protein
MFMVRSLTARRGKEEYNYDTEANIRRVGGWGGVLHRGAFMKHMRRQVLLLKAETRRGGGLHALEEKWGRKLTNMYSHSNPCPNPPTLPLYQPLPTTTVATPRLYHYRWHSHHARLERRAIPRGCHGGSRHALGQRQEREAPHVYRNGRRRWVRWPLYIKNIFSVPYSVYLCSEIHVHQCTLSSIHTKMAVFTC